MYMNISILFTSNKQNSSLEANSRSAHHRIFCLCWSRRTITVFTRSRHWSKH